MKQGWEIKKLGEVFDLQMGKTPSRDNGDYWGGSNVWVAISDLQGKYIGESKEHITDKALIETKIKKVKAGTTIMSFKLSVGRAAITTQDLYTNEAIMAFNLNEGYNLIADYIYYYLKGYKWQGANKAVMGITLNKASISQNHIAIPPLPEQERIVAELDCLSGVTEKKKQQLKELDALAQSIFYTMFGNPITNEKGWEVKKLGEVGKVITGNTPSTKDEENYSSNDYCFVKPSDIGKDYVTNIEKTEFYISDKAFSQSRKLCKGSVLTTCIGIIGKVGILKVDATCNQQINAILPNDNYISEYVAWAIYLTRSVIEDIANAPVVPIINKGEFSNIVIPLPPKDLQQKFADKIEAIERQKQLIKESIQETETLFNARMDYYFN